MRAVKPTRLDLLLPLLRSFLGVVGIMVRCRVGMGMEWEGTVPLLADGVCVVQYACMYVNTLAWCCGQLFRWATRTPLLSHTRPGTEDSRGSV